eukprot:453919_1
MAACDYHYAFVVDESGSTGYTGYKNSIDFVIDLIQGHISDDVQLAGIAFSDGNDLVYHFNQPQLPRGTEVPPTGIIGEFTKEKTDYRGSVTHTATAMRGAIQLFKDEGFTTDNVIILITDGVPYPSTERPCGYQDITDDIDNLNIRVVVVGVSGGFKPTYVQCLVQDATDIILVPSFDQFSNVVTQLESKQLGCVCDMNFDGAKCADDSQCPDCMKCCEGKGVCEPYGMSPAKSVVNSVHDIVSHSDNNYKYGYQMYGYILLVGVILFVLINNVFIGYWCVCKRDNKELYEKCVDVEEEL